jgi:hypothetical protein
MKTLCSAFDGASPAYRPFQAIGELNPAID